MEAEINKRLTLNLLIQGAATHSHLTLHHLVKDELDAIDSDLVELYDKVAVSGFLANWYGDLVLLCGRPKRFWRRTHRRGHPFARHALLATHGGTLAEASRRHAVARAHEKGAATTPGMHYLQLVRLVIQVFQIEADHTDTLEELAKQVTSSVWGIDQTRLEAELTTQVQVGPMRTPTTLVGKAIQAAAAGYSTVIRSGDRFTVTAKAWNWPLLTHELVKGTAELVCLHGLNTLDRETYDQVMEAADRIEYETWHMQAGAELWRRLLAVLPSDRPLAEVLMLLARLEPDELEQAMLTVIERPAAARTLLVAL